jgi:hypothetical protein
VAGILFRDLMAGQFAPPALIDGARLHPQHDCEYKQGTGNGGSTLSIFAHDEPPILSTREHARGLQWRRCSDGFAETLYDALHTIPVFSTAVRPAECRRQHDLDFKAWPMLVPLSSASKSRGVAASRWLMRWRGPGEAVMLVCRLLSVWPNNDSTARQETAALRDFNPAYVGSGSSSD